MQIPKYFDQQEAYRHLRERIQGNVIYLALADVEERDEWAKEIAAVTMAIVVHFKLAGRSRDEIGRITAVAWDVFAEHCKTEPPAMYFDAILDRCVEMAMGRLSLPGV